MKRPRIQDIVSMAVGVILISMAFLSPEILEHNVRITIICGLICFIPFIIRCTGAFTIPLYTMFSRLGLLNTKLPVTLACVLINVPLIIWFLISFFQDLPEEIEESARVDGATEWQLFVRIVLPLVAPGIAAVAMLSFMYAWNEYTYTVIFTRSPSNYTVPLALSVLNTEDNLTNFGLVAAGGVVSVIPITLFVIFAQNYLISGLSSGAVKE